MENISKAIKSSFITKTISILLAFILISGLLPTGIFSPLEAEAYTSGTPGQWTQLIADGVVGSPPKITQLAAGIHGTTLYIANGIDSSFNYYNSMYKYDMSTESGWGTVTQKGDVPTPRDSQHTMPTIGDDLYLYGGYVKDANNGARDFYKFNAPTETWTRLTDGPFLRYYHSLVAIGTDIYLFGGGDATLSTMNNNVYKYDTVLGNWSTVTISSGTAPTIRGHSATVVGTKMYISGGFSASNVGHSNMYVFDSVSRSWTSYPFVTMANYESMAVVGTDIYAFNMGANKIYRYDTLTNTFADVTPSVGPSPGVRVAASPKIQFNGSIYSFGGANAAYTACSNDFWKFTVEIPTTLTATPESGKIYTGSEDITLTAENLSAIGTIADEIEWFCEPVNGNISSYTLTNFDTAWTTAESAGNAGTATITGDNNLKTGVLPITKNGVYWFKSTMTRDGTSDVSKVTKLVVDNIYTPTTIFHKGVMDTGGDLYGITPAYNTIGTSNTVYGIPYEADGTTIITSPTLGYDKIDLTGGYTDIYWMLAPSSNPEHPALELNSAFLSGTIKDCNAGNPYVFTYTKNLANWEDWETLIYFIDEADKPISAGVPPAISKTEHYLVPKAPATMVTAFGAYTPPSALGYVPKGYRITKENGDELAAYTDAAFPTGFNDAITEDKCIVYITYGPGGIRVTEKYEHNDTAYTIQADKITPYLDNSDYNGTAPTFMYYVAVGYKINSEVPVYPAPSGGGYGFNDPQDPITVDILNLTASQTVTFLYETDLNGDGIPDKDANSATVNWIGRYADGTMPTTLHTTQITGRKGTTTTIEETDNGGAVDTTLWIFSGTEPSPATIDFDTAGRIITFYYDIDTNGTGTPDKDQYILVEYVLETDLTTPVLSYREYVLWSVTGTEISAPYFYQDGVGTEYILLEYKLTVDGSSGIIAFGTANSNKIIVDQPVDRNETITFIYVKREIKISGRAKLSGKHRGVIPSVYTPNYAVMDKGIKVELIMKTGTWETRVGEPVYTDGTNITGSTTATNFSLNADSTAFVNQPGKTYLLRFTRIGSYDGIVRDESYLCAEVAINAIANNIIPTADLKLNTDIYLTAGAFVTPAAEKEAITTADIQVIKAMMGATDTQAATKIFNINEYTGVDASDLATVSRFMGKVKLTGTWTFNSSGTGSYTPI